MNTKTTKSSNGEASISELCVKLLKEANSESITRYVTGCIVKKGNKVLLLQRTKDDFMGGIFEIPGGSVEHNESLEDAVKRELLEETGLIAKSVDNYRGSFDYLSGSGAKTRQFNFEVSITEGRVALSEEHQKYVWASKEEIQKYEVSSEVRKILETAF